ncbi:phosphonate ABC transporter, permease protein PhnE [Capsulimonas corticalis]|uniref:Phosphonate ABC transporter, permease protein PhnE n=1 Tax=Capsulimonas corticalis TaxID=2219043 RepID=A0A402CPW1_9BACT|nr:phosphonate ABC transporter, permease protein PhnE [Capsulimonas corticalis]BDI32787.1 phosphonate ABC transporter, permease protein PhnE [Capsulimonas corticalis]
MKVFSILGGIFGLLAIAALVVWSFLGLEVDWGHLPTGLAAGVSFVGRMIPHGRADFRYDLSLRDQIMQPLLDTIQMAVVGTVAGAILAFPMSFVAARTSVFPQSLSAAIKAYLNFSRAVPTIVYALIILSAIGLGKTAGAISIGYVTFISLSKLYAEALESVSIGPIDAVRASGGNSVQVFVFGMMPQVFPHYLATTLYSFEYNLRDSFIIGIVGAGGLGAQLLDSIHEFKLLDTGVIIALLIILVNIVDYGSYRLRAAIS